MDASLFGEEWRITALGTGIALALALLARLGARERPRLTAAMLLLGLHVLTAVVRALVPPSGLRTALTMTASLLFALAIARLAFVVTFDVLIARTQRTPLPRIARDISQGLFFLIGAVLALQASGVEAGHLLTTSALITVGAGLALQETLGNLLAGLALQAERPFDVDDWIEVHDRPGQAGVIGRVREINWRATRLTTLDNVDVVVPNGFLTKAAITNFDRPHGAARRSVYFTTGPEVPTRRIHETVLAAVAGAPGVLDEPPPSLVTHGFVEGGVQFWLRYFIDDMSRRDAIDGGVRDRVWYALARVGVQISVPNRIVHVHEHDEETRRSRSAEAIADRRAALQKIPFLAGAAGPALDRLAERSRLLAYAPGEAVVRQTEPGDTMFLIRRGRLSVRARAGDSPERELATLGPGEFFGEMSLLTGAPRAATVIALESAELLVIDHGSFGELLGAHPELGAAISARVVERRRGLAAAELEAAAEDGEGVEARNLLGKIRGFFGLRE